ncbi:MAG: hypothetical protein ACKOJ7_02210 [Betaproteobacteria bacterium]
MRRTRCGGRSTDRSDGGHQALWGHALHDLPAARGDRSMHERHGKTRKESPWAALVGPGRLA